MGSFVSRRVSEFVGVALFALALMWLISLASYTPADPVWFFTTGAEGATPLNFGGRVGAFLAELSYLRTLERDVRLAIEERVDHHGTATGAVR